MKQADSSRFEALEALLAEKRKQEGYLAKLEERRIGTPEHVFNRLRDEYLTKLTDAQVKAQVEAEQISGGVEQDEAAVVEIEARLAALEDERVELQLRAEVEEWESEEAQQRLTAMSAEIAMAQQERDARRAVAERTRALLTEARRGALADGQPGAVPPAADPPLRLSDAGLAVGPHFDELAFLNSVVGRGSPVPPSPAPPPLPTLPALQIEQPVLELAPATPEQAAPVASEPTVAHVAESLPPEHASPRLPDSELIEPEPVLLPEFEEETQPSSLGRPTPRTSQAIKTLKCAECGSMNYPTEWYCERCGGELAAL